MCGIAGIIGPELSEKEQKIGEMVEKIKHRGPDDDGFFVDENVGLGMRRLSIIDLEGGKQPIFSGDEKSLIFFNGEIYNYKELREELIGKGYNFKTNTDTEVILNLYKAYGSSMLTKLRGMFAFCIYDLNEKKVFIARDFFGIKPLYYLKNAGKIIAFSSEIKSFEGLNEFKKEINDDAVFNYLRFQYNPTEETFFKNVFKLPPAHFLEIDLKTGKENIERYWKFEFEQRELKEKETAEEVREVVEDSVKHHMIADVPVGSFLSGGVDSSIIASLMQKIRGDKKIKTFTVGFDTLTEGEEAKQTSDFLGTDHTEIKIGREEYFKVLPDAMYHFDEPVGDPSAIGLYFVAREARKHVKVVLSGEGADEFFGGYNIYLAPFEYRKIAWLPSKFLKIFTKVPFYYFGKAYLARASEKIENWYIGNAQVFKKSEIEKMWKDKSQKNFSLNSLYSEVAGVSDSTKMQYIDINTWLVGDILAKADKMTMTHSLELRVPFLDFEVAKLAKALPDNLKWKGGVTKYILREAFKNIIPESTRNRKKLGFPVPIREWLIAEKDFISKTILENKYIQKNMDNKFIENLIANHVSKRDDNSRKIYLLLAFSIWYDSFNI